MTTPGEIKSNVENLAARMDIPAELMPSFGKFVGRYAYGYIEGNKYHRVVRRDSPSISDIETPDPAELLYLVLASFTEQMGFIYGILHREPRLNHRRLAFRHQLGLLKKRSTEWELRRAKEIEDLIKWYPYKDTS